MLFLVLLFFTRKPRPVGMVSGLFLVLYGSFRFAVEFFREPDGHIGFDFFDWVTRGQLLSLPMIAVGVGLILWSWLRQGNIDTVR